jgi:hypothetical protein
MNQAQITDIETLHLQACNSCSDTYIDPATGYSVFTAYSHKKRGKCCGSGCRHCPFDYVKVNDVRKRDELRRKAAEVSGIAIKYSSRKEEGGGEEKDKDMETGSVITESSQSVVWATSSSTSSTSTVSVSKSTMED